MPDPSSRRGSLRCVCSVPARIGLGRSVLCDCAVKDYSESGVRLFVAPAAWVPDAFEIDCKTLGGTRKAKIVWRKLGLIGAQFIG